jgi:hypothetical protein
MFLSQVRGFPYDFFIYYVNCGENSIFPYNLRDRVNCTFYITEFGPVSSGLKQERIMNRCY